MGCWRGPPGAECVGVARPSFSGGIGLACAVVPPAHPPTFLGTGGLPLYPRRGCAPCTPLGDGGRGVFSPSAFGRFLACPDSMGNPPSLPHTRGQGRPLILYLLRSSAGFRGLQAQSRNRVERESEWNRCEPQGAVMEPYGCNELVSQQHSHSICSGPSLPWMIVGAGHLSPSTAIGGFSVVSPQSNMYAAGSREEKRAGGPLPGGPMAQAFCFARGGGGEGLW